MYSSGYSQVNKYSPGAQKKMKCHSKGKSCGYYMRIVFFFSSLIQSLIIVSLVLFLIYGKTQDSASTTRIQDLEDNFLRLSMENVALKQQRKNLTSLLNTTLSEKARNDFDLRKLRELSNKSIPVIQDLDRKLQQCTFEAMDCKFKLNPPLQTGRSTLSNCNCMYLERENAKLEVLRSNFTQTTKLMKMDMDQILKERDNFSLEAIHLRRDKSILELQLQINKNKAKEEFQHSLTTVTNVSRAFLQKIDSLFPRHIAFQLTCDKQREHLDQIRTNCTNLSREVEDKLQRYLNNVGAHVSSIQAENDRLKAENSLLSQDYSQCSHKYDSLTRECRQKREELQLKHDVDKEKLLMDKIRLNGELEVLQNSVKYKSKQVDHLMEQIKQLNMSCIPKVGVGFPRLNTQPQLAWSSPGGGGSNLNQLDKPRQGGLGPNFGTGSAFNKPGSTGAGVSSYLPSGSSSRESNTGLGYNKPGSTTGVSSSLGSAGSSLSQGNTGLGYNKPGSTGMGSSSSQLQTSGSSSSQSNTGLGYNKPGSTGGVSSSLGSAGSSSGHSSSGIGSSKPGMIGRGSTVGSDGSNSNLGLTGMGSNKPTSNQKSSFGLGFPSTGSSTSSGSTNRSGSPDPLLSLFGLGSSKTVPQKPSSGSSWGGTGFSPGGGRTSGPGGGSGGSVSQHIRELQHLINPPSQQDKQELSRLLG